MDNHCSPLLSWSYYNQGRSMEELRHSLLCTTLELENTKLAVQEELRKREDELIQLKELLVKAIRERDEAQDKCQRLLIEKLILQQQQQQQQNLNLTVALPKKIPPPLSGASSIEDEPQKRVDSNNALSSSDCEESIVSSPVKDSTPQSLLPPPPPSLSQQNIEFVPEKPLPEKGKLLQAVLKAGPLLQTLLLAGPLPQWRHPPPPLETSKIPPVTIHSPPPAVQTPASAIPPPLLLQESLINITGNSNSSGSGSVTNCGRVSRKRSLFEDSVYPTETKFQRVALH